MAVVPRRSLPVTCFGSTTTSSRVFIYAQSLDLLIPIRFSISVLQYVNSPLLPLNSVAEMPPPTATPTPVLPPPPTSSSTPALLGRTSIENFIRTHLKNVDHQDLEAYTSAYGESVNWYGDGTVSPATIRGQLNSYLDSWDTITYKIAGPIDIQPLPNSLSVRVSYPIFVNNSNSQSGNIASAPPRKPSQLKSYKEI